MKSKSKLIITLAAVVLALIASAVAIVAVVAAQNVTINTSNISIYYTATNIVGDVGAYYKFAPDDDTSISSTSNDGTIGTISYDGSELDGKVTDWSFSSAKTFSRTNNALFFLYTFTNESNLYNAKCTYTKTAAANIEISYKVKTGAGDYGDYTTINVNGGDFNFDVPAVTTSPTRTNGTASCIIMVKIVDVNLNADFKAGFSWALENRD